jgi:ribosomal protein S18 acetylase RimI-like enzyme
MTTSAKRQFFLDLLTNERGFHLLFCDLLESGFFLLYHNESFSEDPIFNHFLIRSDLLQRRTQIDQSEVNSVVQSVKSKAQELKLSTTLFVENFWERKGQFEKCAVDAGYRITDKMEILSKTLTRSSGELAPEPTKSRGGHSRDFEVSYTDDYESWNGVFMSSYSIPPHWRDELIRREKKILLSNSAKFVLAKDLANDSIPCGCLLTFSSGPSGNYLGIYCVGTVPEERGKGVAREMLDFVERNALKQGQKVLTLQTLKSDGVASMYKKTGYKTEFERNIYWSALVS